MTPRVGRTGDHIRILGIVPAMLTPEEAAAFGDALSRNSRLILEERESRTRAQQEQEA